LNTLCIKTISINLGHCLTKSTLTDEVCCR